MCSSDARQLAIKIVGNYSHNHEAIGKPNSQDFESLYPRADLDVAGEGFVATYNDEEALKLIEDSAMTVGHIVDMLPIDMSLG
jgi:hypothetical protein